MSNQRYSADVAREPHSISLKVLRLSRPSLVAQYPIKAPVDDAVAGVGSHPASLAYGNDAHTNPDPFILSPILNLPPSFGSAYVGETFSCTLCVNHDVAAEDGPRQVRDVRVEAEMKTPGADGAVVKLDLGPAPAVASAGEGGGGGGGGSGGGTDLDAGETLQRVVKFDLKEEGNHVLAVTVSYYEATETSGRTRTFRKLYQFICKPSMVVRTKASALEATSMGDKTAEKEGKEQQEQEQEQSRRRWRRWALEAQLENCSEDAVQLDRVVLELEPGLVYTDCNWGGDERQKPVLHPGEVEQVCFVVREVGAGCEAADGKIVFGVLGVGWRGEMGNRGFLSTGKLGTRFDG